MPYPPLLIEYDDAVLRSARRLSLRAEADRHFKGRFTMAQLRKSVRDELSISLPRSPKDGPLGRLIGRGKIVQFPAKERVPGSEHGNGTANVYRVRSVDGLHLGVLMELAASATDSTLKGQRGRKGLNLEARQIDRISPSQFDKIRTMARHVGFHLQPSAETEEEAFAAVSGAYLMWDPAAGLEGDWRLFYDLIRASRPPRGRLADDISAARTLLDLAATHGFLLREARSRSFVVPTGWVDVQAHWVEAARHPGIAAVLGVNFLLGAIAEVLGSGADPTRLTAEQTGRVIEHVEAALVSDSGLRTGHRSSIRRSIRRLMQTGLVPPCDVNSWDYRQRHRMAAWSQTVTNAIAASIATEHRGGGLDRKPDGYSAWSQFPFPALADRSNPYSIARCLDFHTAKGRERARLEFRALGSYPTQPPRGDSNLTRQYWGEATVKIRLNALALYVGWIQRYTGINLQTATLADLLTLELVERFVDAVDAGEWSTPEQARRVLVTIGLIASPCLEDEALKAGDATLADQFYLVSCLATGRGRRGSGGRYDGRTLYRELGEREDVATDSVKRQKAQAEAVEAAYRAVLNVDWAYDGMVRVYEAAAKHVLRLLGVVSMAELRERWGCLTIRPADAEFLRALAIWNLSLAAPLRTATQRKLTRGMILDLHGRRLDINVPAELLKVDANGDYHIKLWSPEDGGGFDIDLMLTYLMDGGIGDRLLNGAESDLLWVNSFARGNTRRPQVLGATLVAACKTVIKRAAAELGLTADQQQQLMRVAKIHPFRHAVAGRLVALGRIEDARLLLHHRKYDTILKVYSANGRNVSTGTVRADAKILPDSADSCWRQSPELRQSCVPKFSGGSGMRPTVGVPNESAGPGTAQGCSSIMSASSTGRYPWAMQCRPRSRASVSGQHHLSRFSGLAPPSGSLPR